MKPGYCVFDKTNDCLIGLNVGSAFTPFGRMKGLLGRLRIGEGEGVWIAPAHGVHTFGLLFPVDVVFLDADRRVIHLIEHLRPFRITALVLNSASALELPAHTIYASRIRVGDQLVICPPGELATLCAAGFAPGKDHGNEQGVLQ